MNLKVRKIIDIAIDIILIAVVFAITDHLMLNVIKSESIWLELGIYIVFYGIVFGGKSGIVYLWKRSKRKNEIAISNISAIINGDVHKVWDIVYAVEKYGLWRSDLSKAEIINEKQFIEYTKDGYATTFFTTVVEPYKRWEFDMENSNMTGHWIGVFTAKGNETQIDFTENVTPKKWFMKPCVKIYLKKHQKQFVLDLKKALE